MSCYLFGDMYKSVGAVNGVPVVVKTIFSFSGSKTIVKIGGKEHVFSRRAEAYEYLRRLEKLKGAEHEQ